MAQPIPLLRTSERAAFKRCQLRWWWGFREGLKPGGTDHGPLWFGTGMHLALAEWYIPGTERGRDPRETWTEFVEDSVHDMVRTTTFGAEEEQVFDDAITLGKHMLNYYLATYGLDEKWEIIAPEQTFAVTISDPRSGVGYPTGDRVRPLAVYVGTFDGVYRNRETGKIWLLEHKTAAQINTKHLVLDDQPGSYLMVAETVLRNQGKIGPHETIEGVMYNFLAKRKPSDKPRDAKGRYLNKDGSVSKIQPSDTLLRQPVRRSIKQKLMMEKRIQTEAIQMEPFRTDFDALTKNPTRDCSWDCSFFELCQVHETGGDYEEFIRNVMVVEDPYIDHRLGAKNTKESVQLHRERLGRGGESATT